MDEKKDITIINTADCISELLSSIDEVELEENRLMVSVAVKLRRLRRALGLTQLEAAEKCGMKQAMVSKMESGDYNPSIGSLFRYVARIGGEFELAITPQISASTQVVGSCECYSLVPEVTLEVVSNKLSQANHASTNYTYQWKDTSWSKAG